jgi:hypothetical protein
VKDKLLSGYAIRFIFYFSFIYTSMKSRFIVALTGIAIFFVFARVDCRRYQPEPPYRSSPNFDLPLSVAPVKDIYKAGDTLRFSVTLQAGQNLFDSASLSQVLIGNASLRFNQFLRIIADSSGAGNGGGQVNLIPQTGGLLYLSATTGMVSSGFEFGCPQQTGTYRLVYEFVLARHGIYALVLQGGDMFYTAESGCSAAASVRKNALVDYRFAASQLNSQVYNGLSATQQQTSNLTPAYVNDLLAKRQIFFIRVSR